MEELEDRIVAVFEQMATQDPANPAVAEVHACLGAGDRAGAVRLIMRTWAPRNLLSGPPLAS